MARLGEVPFDERLTFQPLTPQEIEILSCQMTGSWIVKTELNMRNEVLILPIVESKKMCAQVSEILSWYPVREVPIDAIRDVWIYQMLLKEIRLIEGKLLFTCREEEERYWREELKNRENKIMNVLRQGYLRVMIMNKMKLVLSEVDYMYY